MLRFRPHPQLKPLSGPTCPKVNQIRTFSIKKPPDPENLNYSLLNKIYQEYKQYSTEKEASSYKLRAFTTALDSLKDLPFKVRQIEDVEKLKGVGAGMRRRIEEFLLEEARTDEDPSVAEAVETRKEFLNSVQNFQTLSGIGPIKAQQFAANKRWKTLEDIMQDKAFSKLPGRTQTALQFSSKILEQVPREDVNRIVGSIANILEGFEVHGTGSFRRGSPHSSEIEILLFHPTFKTAVNPEQRRQPKKLRGSIDVTSLLPGAISLLQESRILAATLISSPTRWQGYGALAKGNGQVCRVEIKLVPMDAKGAALVVYTGDDEFCKNLRGKARDIGCKLNAKGLWKYPEFVQSSLGEEERWELVPTRSERDVFDYLHEEWVEPDKRNFTNLLAKRRKR